MPKLCCTCSHSYTLHNSDGTCSVPGCACDELKLPEIDPDVAPPTPGACVHTTAGAIWVLEGISEVKERLEGVTEFAEFNACDFEDGKFCTYPLHVRPMTVTGYHGFIPERWEKILKEVR